MTSIDLRLSGARARGRVTFLPPPASRRSPTPTMPASAIAQAPPRPSAAARRASTRRMSRASTLSTSPRAASSAAPALVTPSARASRPAPTPRRTTVCSASACSRPSPRASSRTCPAASRRPGTASRETRGSARSPTSCTSPVSSSPGTTRCSARARTRRTCWSRPGSRRRWTCGAALRCPGTSSVCATAPTSCTTTTSGTRLAAVDALEGQTVFVPTHQKEGEAARRAVAARQRRAVRRALPGTHRAHEGAREAPRDQDGF